MGGVARRNEAEDFNEDPTCFAQNSLQGEAEVQKKKGPGTLGGFLYRKRKKELAKNHVKSLLSEKKKTRHFGRSEKKSRLEARLGVIANKGGMTIRVNGGMGGWRLKGPSP